MEVDGPRHFVAVFGIGEEIVASLRTFASERGISGACFSGVGVLERATIAYWQCESKAYREMEIDEQVEVLSLAGNIALSDGAPKIHARILVGRRDGSAIGGHLCAGSSAPRSRCS